jgi:hypothetical protein
MGGHQSLTHLKDRIKDVHMPSCKATYLIHEHIYKHNIRESHAE